MTDPRLVDNAIRELYQNAGEEVEFSNREFDVQRSDATLKAELEPGEFAYSVDCNGAVGILSFESEIEVLYFLKGPLTLTRELLRLEGATVREEVQLANDENRRQLSIELADRRVLGIRGFGTFGRDQQAQFRSEVERRVRRLAR